MHFQCNVWIYVFDKHTFLTFVTVLNRIFSKTEDGLVLATKNDQNKVDQHNQKNQLKAVKEEAINKPPKITQVIVFCEYTIWITWLWNMLCCHWILDIEYKMYWTLWLYRKRNLVYSLEFCNAIFIMLG